MLPATLQEDEAARFCAALPAGARDSALLLLRSLLHPDPAQRPRHAIQISRMLHAIQGMQPERNYLDVTDPVRGMRPPPPTAGKPCGAHDVGASSGLHHAMAHTLTHRNAARAPARSGLRFPCAQGRRSLPRCCYRRRCWRCSYGNPARPAAWQPASIALRLAAGDSIELGARELAAAQADRRHLRLRRDAQRGWLVQNLSSTHRLLLRSGDTEQHSGSHVLADGQRVS
jgi:hypothetical protein